MIKEKITFEEAINRLESIAKEFEQGNLTLEESMSKFEEAVELSQFCHKKLNEIQGRIERLIEKNGHLSTELVE